MGLAALFSLSDETRLQLISEMGKLEPTLKPKILVSTITAKLSTITTQDIEPVINTIASLSFARMSMEKSVSAFSADIVEALEESEHKPQGLNESNRDSFVEHLAKLLDIPAIRISSKSDELLHQHEHALSKVRIITDIRPVFGEDATNFPDAAVLIHMLKITYIQEDSLKDFFVAMDSNDIKLLREALDRAEKKAESLKSILNKSDIFCVEMD
jgi:hypothetical protein